MSEGQSKQSQTQLWNIANNLRDKMGADEFRDERRVSDILCKRGSFTAEAFFPQT